MPDRNLTLVSTSVSMELIRLLWKDFSVAIPPLCGEEGPIPQGIFPLHDLAIK